MLLFETNSWPFFAKAKSLKSQSDDNMIKASVVEMHGVDSLGEEGSGGGERSAAVIAHASAASELRFPALLAI